MSYQIKLRPVALRYLKKLPRKVLEQLDDAIQALRKQPRPPGTKRLKGKHRGYLRIRVGDRRIIYHVDDDTQTIRIARIGDRKDVYRTE